MSITEDGLRLENQRLADTLLEALDRLGALRRLAFDLRLSWNGRDVLIAGELERILDLPTCELRRDRVVPRDQYPDEEATQ